MKEGARGSSAVRKANCHDVARAGGLSRRAERIAKGARSMVCEREIGLSGMKLLLVTCGPMRDLTGRAVVSKEQTECGGHCLPLSKVLFESLKPRLTQSSQETIRDCPEANSQNAGMSATSASFTRFITGLTRRFLDRSLGFGASIFYRIAFEEMSHAGGSGAITKFGGSCSIQVEARHPTTDRRG